MKTMIRFSRDRQVGIQEMKYNNCMTLFGLVFVFVVIQLANGQGVIVKKGEKILPEYV